MEMINRAVQNFSKTEKWKKLVKFMGSTRIFPKRKLRLTKNDFKECQECAEIIRPGDVLLSKVWDQLNNIVIPGEYDHSALYIGNGEIIETRGYPVSIRPLKKMFYADKVLLIRPQCVDEEYIQRMIEESKKYLGWPYDYAFSMRGEKEVYCSEFIYYADFEKRLSIPVKERFGVKSVAPDDFLKGRYKEIKSWK